MLAPSSDVYDLCGDFLDPYWTSLTPERAFLARVFVDHCCETDNSARLEATLPVVTALAFRIQEAYNGLVDVVRESDENQTFLRPEGLLKKPRDCFIIERTLDLAKDEDDRADKEFIISEMLKLGVKLDYSDEIGRRKMFQLLRKFVEPAILP